MWHFTMKTVCSCEWMSQVFWLVSYYEAVGELQKSSEMTLDMDACV